MRGIAIVTISLYLAVYGGRCAGGELPKASLVSLVEIRNILKETSYFAYNKTDEELLSQLVNNMYDGPLAEYRHRLPTTLPTQEEELEKLLKGLIDEVLNITGINLTPDELFESVLNIGLSSIDPYFLYEGKGNKINNRDKGMLGIQLLCKSGNYFVSALPNSPGFGKIAPGSQLLKISGTPVFGRSSNRIETMLTGVVAETVDLELANKRGRAVSTITFSEFRPVDFVVHPQENFISIIELNEHCLNELRKNAPRFSGKELTMDLRYFKGGNLKLAAMLTDFFLDEGERIFNFRIVGKRKVNGEEAKGHFPSYLMAKHNPIFSPSKIKILQGPLTASAAEGFIIALKQSKRFSVVTRGQQSFGKALIRRRLELTNGEVIQYSVGKMVRNDGSDWEGTGLKPDIVE